MRLFNLITVCLLIAVPVCGQREVELGIKSTFADLIPLSVAPFTAVDGAKLDQAKTLEQLVTADLEFSGIFKVTRGHVPQAGDGNDDLVEIRGILKQQGAETHFEGLVVDASNRVTIGGKRYLVKSDQVRRIAHHFSDEVVRMLTGENGIASTRIVYRQRKGDSWEIVIADYDGYNPRVVLRQTVSVIFPRWIDDCKALVFTNFREKNADLYIRYLNEPASQRLLTYPGLNYSVDWSQKKKEMLVTLSKDGNPEIYVVGKDGKIKRRLTHSRAIDCSPSWSPSGREVAFTSDRTGTPQIYLMQADGSNVRRLSQFGNYNDSSAWSPKGDRIVFVSRMDGFSSCVQYVRTERISGRSPPRRSTMKIHAGHRTVATSCIPKSAVSRTSYLLLTSTAGVSEYCPKVIPRTGRIGECRGDPFEKATVKPVQGRSVECCVNSCWCFS